MQVTETLSEGLKREYKVVFPASELAERLDGRLDEMKDKLRIKGFRPGKVPLPHLRRIYGRSVMADLFQEIMQEANQKIVEEHHLRPALQPEISFPKDAAEVEAAIGAKGDLSFEVSLETLPKIEIGSFDDIAVVRPVTPLDEEEIEKALERVVERSRNYHPKEGLEVGAENGDRLTIDYIGTLKGEAFENGTATDVELVLGSESFIPGFEEQLIGVKLDEKKEVSVTFPENYTAAKLAGQPALFAVTINKIESPEPLPIDDELAKSFGFEDLDAMRKAVQTNLQADLDQASRDKLKRALLDELDIRYKFEVPSKLVGIEFENIWNQVETEQKQSGRSFEDENTTEEKAREEYRTIAERRVRLGLLLAEIGAASEVKVTQEELSEAIMAKARLFSGNEKAVWDYYTKNPDALAQIKAPLFEDKVIDLLIAQIKVTDETVSREELFKVIEDESV